MTTTTASPVTLSKLVSRHEVAVVDKFAVKLSSVDDYARSVLSREAAT